MAAFEFSSRLHVEHRGFVVEKPTAPLVVWGLSDYERSLSRSPSLAPLATDILTDPEVLQRSFPRLTEKGPIDDVTVWLFGEDADTYRCGIAAKVGGKHYPGQLVVAKGDRYSEAGLNVQRDIHNLGLLHKRYQRYLKPEFHDRFTASGPATSGYVDTIPFYTRALPHQAWPVEPRFFVPQLGDDDARTFSYFRYTGDRLPPLAAYFNEQRDAAAGRFADDQTNHPTESAHWFARQNQPFAEAYGVLWHTLGGYMPAEPAVLELIGNIGPDDKTAVHLQLPTGALLNRPLTADGWVAYMQHMRISAYSGDEELQLRPFGETDPALLTAYLQGLERSLVKKRTAVVMSGDKIYEYPDFRHKDA